MITFIIFLFLAQALASCPDGSITVASDCYMVPQQKMTWFEAQEVKCAFFVFYFHILTLTVFIFLPLQFCWDHGGHLAEFSTENKESLIDLYLPEHIWYWIGLTDETVEGMPN